MKLKLKSHGHRFQRHANSQLKVSDQNSSMVDLIDLNDLRKQLSNKKSVGCCI